MPRHVERGSFKKRKRRRKPRHQVFQAALSETKNVAHISDVAQKFRDIVNAMEEAMPNCAVSPHSRVEDTVEENLTTICRKCVTF